MAHYTVNEIAAKYRRHPVTVRRALATGTLYGIQRVPRGKWIITEADRSVTTVLLPEDY